MNTQSTSDEILIGETTGEVRLRFDAGTLILEGVGRDANGVNVPRAFVWDERIRRWRAPAHKYRQVFAELVRANIAHTDEARDYHEFDFIPKTEIKPRPYQHQAIEAWRAHGRRGVVVLPTGAGKPLSRKWRLPMCAVRRSSSCRRLI